MTNVYITKTGFIEDEAIFKFFKEEANDTVKNNLDCIDKDLQRTIILLNQFPGLATRFCCSGHLEDPDNHDFYIVTVVRDQITYDLLENVVYNFNKHIVEQEGFCNSDETIFSKHLAISKHGMLVTNIGAGVLFYPTVDLRSFSGPIIDPVSLDVLEDEIQSQYERTDLTAEEVKELQRRLDNFERVEEIFYSLHDTLSDYRTGTHPREDRQTIIETIKQIEEYGDYLDDEDREELSRTKEEIKSN